MRPAFPYRNFSRHVRRTAQVAALITATVCAATASSSAEAGRKAEVLACLKRVRYAGAGLAQALMAVMLDAAVEMETERWAVRH